jgi:hypothetical protein
MAEQQKYGGGAENYARFKQYDYRAVSGYAKHQSLWCLAWHAGGGVGAGSSLVWIAQGHRDCVHGLARLQSWGLITSSVEEFLHTFI